MSRATNNVASRARRKKMFGRAKGYLGKRKNTVRQGTEAVHKAGVYAYVGRRDRKGQFRRLWIVRINAAAHEHGLSYSRFMSGLKRLAVELDRKQLAELAVNDPPAFRVLAQKVQAALGQTG